jgi:hypothetical protein
MTPGQIIVPKVATKIWQRATAAHTIALPRLVTASASQLAALLPVVSGLPQGVPYGGSLQHRPDPQLQPALPAFDPQGAGGITWTVWPPEFGFVPNPSKQRWRGDFGGINLPSAPPWEPGANSTPYTMIMTFLINEYPRVGQDMMLTGSAVRSYSHFHAAPPVDRTSQLSCQAQVDLFNYIISWGNYVSYWAVGTPDGHFNSWADAQPLIEPFLRALVAAGAATCEKTICIVGEELNSCTSPAGLQDIVRHMAAICGPAGIDLWLHFTPNYFSWPDGGTQVEFWEQMDAYGVLGLCAQLDGNDPAGLQAAHLYDGRRYLSQASPNLRMVMFENQATNQLYGRSTEQYGILRDVECNMAPMGDTTSAVMGGGNGWPVWLEPAA